MILNISEIPDGHSKISKECMLDSVKNDLPPMSGNLKCHGDVNRIGDSIYLHLWYEGVFTLQCARCLEKFQSPMKGDIQVIIKESAGRHGRADENEEQVDFYYDPNDETLDIGSAFYDDIMIEIPLMPLCFKDCKGVQVNAKDITVDFTEKKKNESEIDPRWEALRKLKK